ncbi:MAG: TetR/AcrR family transcriptional regulator [Candidatus Cloacimonadales bacterium]|jgi:TetR/AcrR family fatty acid metabolism transcriptional regulator|nr:TetR/AcrR family transcriptional regulator [Candidatus Cloacimonadota bacterium]MDD2650608.1 TetR/AcrR family transcriptional regulator [Candidatus Cloacimonadota bacterium]MDX9977741.1 TetR/AcrR family transcriptional regulator [Candidatus Cloacimonadales bacterium]
MAYEKTDMNNRKTKKRNDLIKAAIKTFAQKGFHGTKISDIAKKAKVADGTVYLYFENKDDLLIKCFEEMLADLMQKADEKLSTIEDPLAKVLTFIDLHIDYCEKNPDAAKLIIIELRQSPEFYKKYPNFWPVRNYLNYLNKLCTDAIEAGRIRNVNPELLTTIIFGSLDFSITSWLLSKSVINLKSIKEGVADILHKGLEKEANNEK